MPLDELALRLDELAGWRGRLVACHCEAGARSLRAAELLHASGFARFANLDGGYAAWRRDRDRRQALAEPSEASRTS